MIDRAVNESGQSVEDVDGTLLRVARLYYEQNLSQEEIASRVHKSRTTVSRLLTAAREQGIVEIRVRALHHRVDLLERSLIETYRLRDARVIAVPEREASPIEFLGQAGAQYLRTVLTEGHVVGVSYGRTLAATARNLEPQPSVHITVAQIVGATTTHNSPVDGPDVVRAFASAYSADCRFLHLPILVKDARARRTLLADPQIQSTLDLGASADIAIVGVGTLDAHDRSPFFEGLVSEADMNRMQRQGVIGHICGQYYNQEGVPLDVDVNRRAIAIGLGALSRIPRVVGIAGGGGKVESIRAALNGGLINVLVTDNWAAERLLQLPSNS